MLAILSLLLLAPPGGSDSLQALSRDFWSWRSDERPASEDDVQRLERPPGWMPHWSSEVVAKRRIDLQAFEERLRNLRDLAQPVAYQVDYRLLGSALARARFELDRGLSWRRDPGFYVDQTLGVVVEALLPPPPFSRERSRDLVSAIAAIPRVLREGRENLDDARLPFSRLASERLKGAAARLAAAADALKPLLDPESRPRLDGATKEAGAALDAFREWLVSREGHFSTGVALGREDYLFFLRKVALLPLSPEEILAIGRLERERATELEVYDELRNRDLPPLGVFSDRSRQIEAARRQEEEVRRFLTEKKILTIPEWMPHYVYVPLPPYLQALRGFGEETDFAFPSRLRDGARRYIPDPSPDLPYFALSMAKDPRADMVHEGVPGHGFQLILSRAQEDEIRRHWYDSSINEGLGFYCEELMLRMGLFDDSPRTREILDSFMRLRAIRVEVDVGLALGTLSLEGAAAYLQKTTPMDLETARAEAAAFARFPGFAIDYQIGKTQIVGLIADARRKQGDAFELQVVHDFIWKNGNVPVVLQRLELLGDPSGVDALGEP